MSILQVSSNMNPVKCPLCSVSCFTAAKPLLEHFPHCVLARHTSAYSCLMCNLSFPSLVDALTHVGMCGREFCGLVFNKSTVSVSDVSQPVVQPNEPPPPNFMFPSIDPFRPGPAEMLRRATITAQFLLIDKYFDSFTPTGPNLLAPWDFLYHRQMKRLGPKTHDLRTISPNRGSTYSPVMHVKRRLTLLSATFTDADVKLICKHDRELSLDYAHVARRYLDLFIFQHFTQSLTALKEWDAQCHPPNGSGKYDCQRNLYSISDARSAARHHLLQFENPIFFKVLDVTYTCVRFSLNCSSTLSTFSDWINTGRNITVLERSSNYPPVSNFLVRTIKDVIDQHSRVLYHRVPKAKIRQYGLLGAHHKVGPSPPSSTRTSRSPITETNGLDNDSVSAITQSASYTSTSLELSSNDSTYVPRTPTLNDASPTLNNAVIQADIKEEMYRRAIEQALSSSLSDDDSLCMVHNDHDVATGGMDYVKPPELPFSIQGDRTISSRSRSTNAAVSTDVTPPVRPSEPVLQNGNPPPKQPLGNPILSKDGNVPPTSYTSVSTAANPDVHPALTNETTNNEASNRALALLAYQAHQLKVSKKVSVPDGVSKTDNSSVATDLPTTTSTSVASCGNLDTTPTTATVLPVSTQDVTTEEAAHSGPNIDIDNATATVLPVSTLDVTTNESDSQIGSPIPNVTTDQSTDISLVPKIVEDASAITVATVSVDLVSNPLSSPLSATTTKQTKKHKAKTTTTVLTSTAKKAAKKLKVKTTTTITALTGPKVSKKRKRKTATPIVASVDDTNDIIISSHDDDDATVTTIEAASIEHVSNSLSTRSSRTNTKKKKQRKAKTPGGMCCRHHDESGYKMETIEGSTSLVYYKLNNLHCSGFEYMKSAKEKSECIRSNINTPQVLHICHHCALLSKADDTRFFLCSSCNGKYHLGNIPNFKPPPNRRRKPLVR